MIYLLSEWLDDEQNQESIECGGMGNIKTLARAAAAWAINENIEITPEMIEAGYDALFDDPKFPEGGRKSTCNALTLAFKAMLRARR